MTLRPLNVIDIHSKQPFTIYQVIGEEIRPLVFNPGVPTTYLQGIRQGTLFIETDPPDCNAGQIEIEELEPTLF